MEVTNSQVIYGMTLVNPCSQAHDSLNPVDGDRRVVNGNNKEILKVKKDFVI